MGYQFLPHGRKWSIHGPKNGETKARNGECLVVQPIAGARFLMSLIVSCQISIFTLYGVTRYSGYLNGLAMLAWSW